MSAQHPWIELGRELGASIHRGLDGRTPLLQLRVAETVVTAGLEYGNWGWGTHVQAYYWRDGSFRFGIRSTRVSTEMSKLLFGTQDIIVGDKSFDRRFVVRGSDEARIRALFSRPSVLEALRGYWNLTLTAGAVGRWQAPRGVRGLGHLSFKSGGAASASGAALSVRRLRKVFGLFGEILAEISVETSVDEDDVPGLISRLRSPGGGIGTGPVLLWDGHTRRREAARRLGELKAPEAVQPLIEAMTANDGLRLVAVRALKQIGDPEAVRPLIEVLVDPDSAVRLAAVDALHHLGHPAAVAPLAGLLADHERVGPIVIWERAAQALVDLGAGDLVHGFQEALQGRPTALRDCVYRHRAAKPVARALTAVMGGSDLSAVEAAGQVLGWLGSADVLRELRRIERMTGWDRSRKACRKAIAVIEAKPSLPRAADRPEEDGAGTLPRVAGAPEADPEGLPRPVKGEGDH